ncbi:MAG: leucine-rich repeat domain-containing protein [Paludibacteraceae bacterium]|nr:leucine-rich repeat domain-containing protein [Paludibacteraceae bacterium]
MKKLFALIVAICATTLAWADTGGNCGENVTYFFASSTGTLTISGTGAMRDYYDSSKAPWNAYSSSIKKVVINNGVTSVGTYAFRDCTGLTSVTIPNNVTRIGSSAFWGCTGLTSINVAEDNLNYASIDGILYSKDKKTLIMYPQGKTGSITIPNSVTSIGAGAFGGCTGLTSVTIPNSVTEIGGSAFYNCTGLTSITIGNGVTSVGEEAFYGCDNIETADINSQAALNAIYFKDKLTSIILGDGVTSIRNYAFEDCTGLTSVTINNGVTSIGREAFRGCTGLTSITIGNDVTSIGGEAFRGCTGLTNITIGNDVTSIGYQAFYGCTGLTSVTIPNSVTSIGTYPFYGCTGLTSINVAEDNLNYASIDGVLYSKDKKTLIMYPQGKTGSFTIPNSVTSIGERAFYNCTGLTSITIPNSVTSIGNYAFSACTGLTSITIPNSVTSIGERAFYNCTGLTSVETPNSVTSVGKEAFSGCDNIETADISSQAAFKAIAFNDKLTSIILGDGVTSIAWNAFHAYTGLTSINVAEDNLNYASIDGVLYSKDKKTLIRCPMGKTGSVTIPNSVTSIGDEAFYGCTKLTSTTIPNSVTSIGYAAFRNCTGLTSMTVEATTPPSSGGIVSNYNIPLNVPAASVDAYKAATEWKKFTNIQAIPATGVNEAAAEKSEVKKIIDRNGIIYIEKDGTRYFLNGGKAE